MIPNVVKIETRAQHDKANQIACSRAWANENCRVKRLGSSAVEGKGVVYLAIFSHCACSAC